MELEEAHGFALNAAPGRFCKAQQAIQAAFFSSSIQSAVETEGRLRSTCGVLPVGNAVRVGLGARLRRPEDPNDTPRILHFQSQIQLSSPYLHGVRATKAWQTPSTQEGMSFLLCFSITVFSVGDF